MIGVTEIRQVKLEALGTQLENASAFFQRSSQELLRQSATSAERAELYRLQGKL